jgi:hypothetical protein
MASILDSSAPRSLTSPMRSLVAGAGALLLIAIGLQVLTAEETSFYRSHGMVPDARTAVRLAQLVLADHREGCALAGAPAARLDGEVWTVEGWPQSGLGVCRVLLSRRDGQVLKIEAQR